MAANNNASIIVNKINSTSDPAESPANNANSTSQAASNSNGNSLLNSKLSGSELKDPETSEFAVAPLTPEEKAGGNNSNNKFAPESTSQNTTNKTANTGANNMFANANSSSKKPVDELEDEMEDMDEKPATNSANGTGSMNNTKPEPENEVSGLRALNNKSAENETSAADTATVTAPENNIDIKIDMTEPKRTKKTATKTGKNKLHSLKNLSGNTAHLIINKDTGSLRVKPQAEPEVTTVKLNVPQNKAQIKLKTFKAKYEKELAAMKRMSHTELQELKAKLATIEFEEVANTNIINGLVELVDDLHLKQLTVEKMLKMGDISINF